MVLGLALSVTVFGQRPDPNARTVWLLENVRIKELRFQDAEIGDVLNFFVHASREADPEGLGINLAYFAPTPDQPPPQKVNLTLRNIELGHALRLATEMSGLVYRLDRGVIRVQTRQAQKTETRFYPVDAAQFERFTSRTQAK